ncbi:MAG: type II toxin-antitoxin system RelE/ParE family toxin [Lachnospiraceae bacterium]|nr:type II toxin-antitoxin system RelE/ParE family toxin [Lachnospiraceae bacterium]
MSMEYNIQIMPSAQARLRAYINYTKNYLRNPSAATRIADDSVNTAKKLIQIADSIKLCDNPILREYGYRKMRFLQHKFIMIFRIDYDSNTIVVDGMYHELQDYESLFIDEMNLS